VIVPRLSPHDVTVFMPVYNAAPYVAGAIASVLTQTHQDFSLLVIDDGSTDTSLREIQRAVSTDPRCSVISRDNRGIVATRNEGIEATRGEYIFCVDADDIAHQERFARQLAYLKDHPDCVALGTQTMICDPSMLPIMPMIDVFDHEAMDRKHMHGDAAICNSSVAMRRKAVIDVGGYLAEFEWAEDFDLFLRIAERGRLANLPETLHFYRQHAASVGHSKRSLQIERTRRSVETAHVRRGLVTPEWSSSESFVSTLAEIHRKWAWWALSGGHPGTARKHALLAIRHDPWRFDNLALIQCALRGK